MDTPRHRFRRESVEGDSSADDASPVEQKLRSIEKELDKVSNASLVQARDILDLRARAEALEGRSGTDIEATLSKVYDHIEIQDDRVEQVFDRMQVLERRLQEVGHRLDNLGEIGRLENLPALLEQSLVTSLDDLEARFEARLNSLEASSSSAIDGEMVRAEVAEKNTELRAELDKLLEARQEELSDYLQEVLAGLNLEELQGHLETELTVIRNAVVELQEFIEKVPGEEEIRAIVKAAEVSADSPALVSLQGDIDDINKKLKPIEGIFSGGADWVDKVKNSVDIIERSSDILEQHEERVDLALRLVKQLEEGTDRIGRGESGGGGRSLGSLVPPPGESQLKLTLRDLMREMVKNRVSDLHIKTGRAITARIGRELIQFSTPPLTPADCFHLITSALKPNLQAKLAQERDIEFVYQYESVRLRANVFFDRGNLSATFKMLSTRPPELEGLGLPKAYSGLLGRTSGLVVLAGLPGSGRSTTLTASLDYLNRTRQLHLVALEDRIDYTHEDRRSLVTQREFGVDISSYAQGVRRAIGQDCDVLFVADLQDRDTMESVFAACEAGILVVGTVVAHSAEDAIPRLISLFPESERKLRAMAFASIVQGILTQKLFHRADGEGLVPAAELLLTNEIVQQAIHTANLGILSEVMGEAQTEGMQTFPQSVERLVETGLITAEEAQRELFVGRGHAKSGAAVLSTSQEGNPQKPQVRPQESSQESPPSIEASSSEDVPEAFGEEDTLMNWL